MVPVVTVEGGSAQTVIANARNVLATQQQQSASTTNYDNNSAANADLIRQLNVARAQGDVILQHWGDKQVLVHKATGRWIMRQGNRLVTVPPQALGITTSNSSSSMSSSSSSSSNDNTKLTLQGQTIVRSMSSSTMEQLAEFDSILESKFKSSSPSPPAIASAASTVSLPDVVASATTSVAQQAAAAASIQNQPKQGPTFVIIAPSAAAAASVASNSNAIQFGGNKNIVAVSVGGSTLSGKTAADLSKINGTLKLATTSSSAPSSPVKTIKIQSSSQPQSVSASASPTSTGTTAASAVASAAASAAAVAAGFVKPPPKPQEDPDTLKRIQQILDDYNEQIRNSPDLQNRPAPRRRTNGPPSASPSGSPNVTTSIVTTPPSTPGLPSAVATNPISIPQSPSLVSPIKKRPSLSSGSPNSSSGSESPGLLLQSQNNNSDFEFMESSNSNSSHSQDLVKSSIPQPVSKPILRQIMVPPALAASLQATGKQLVFITGSGGKKIIAMRPLQQATTPAPNAGGQLTSTPSMVGSTMVKATRISGSSISIPSPPPLITTSSNLVLTTSTSSSSSQIISNVCSNASSAGSTSSCSPPPAPSSTSSLSSSEPRPITPILGIPMEMTPCQIMEAEISGSILDDHEDTDVQPQEQPASTSGSLRLPDDHLGSEVTLPDNLFTPESPSNLTSTNLLHKPPVITEETEIDTDDVNDDLEEEASSTDSVMKLASRKRTVSGNEDSKNVGIKRGRGLTGAGRTAVVVSAVPSAVASAATSVGTGMRTRTRNLSSHLKNKPGIGIITTESSLASSISKKS